MSKWGGGTAILSPRDLSPNQLLNISTQITDLPGGQILLDPQVYLPHADHERLCSHDYWPCDYNTGTFFQGHAGRELVRKLVDLNKAIGSREIILPGLLANDIDDIWIESQRSWLEIVREVAGNYSVISTIALGADVIRNQNQIDSLLEVAPSWNADGFYIVCEHPNGNYLVEEPLWIANVLDLVAELRFAGARVILGYCNHQMLVANLVQATAICSGTWMNVRSFPPEKFRTAYEEEIRQRATWYYCPQALSEYKVPFLDIAWGQRILGTMAPPPELDGGYTGRLFEGPQPTTVGFSEQLAFRHYLHALRGQVRALESESYDEARSAQDYLLNEAEDFLRTLNSIGIYGQKRDFTAIIDVNRAALALLHSRRGALLRRRWNSLNS